MIPHRHVARARVERPWHVGPLTSLVLPPPESWTLDALCAQSDPEAWFPEKGGTTNPAKRICAICPVMEDCLAYALEHGETFGVWGGTSYRERLKLQLAPTALKESA